MWAVALALVVTAGCTPDEPAPRTTDGGVAELARVGAELASTVTGALDPLPATDRTYDEQPQPRACGSGSDDWPQQQAFNGAIFLPSDAREFARQLTERLAGDGWGITDNGRVSGDTSRHYTAGRRGFLLMIVSAGLAPYGLTIIGSSPCVRADGSHQRAGG